MKGMISKAVNILQYGGLITISKHEVRSKVPMLDAQMWVEHGEGNEALRHVFYEKDSSSKFMLMNQSTMAIHKKIQILANEVIRRSRTLPQGSNPHQVHGKDGVERVSGKGPGTSAKVGPAGVLCTSLG